jgi:UDP-N-acetylmuramyl pentapeptide phosphotransferase/UDP-N-acetylglucosamine-1-phosphate transferase
VTRALLALGPAALAWGATRVALNAAIPSAPLRKANYRGLSLPSGLGVVLIAGLLAGVALTGLVHALAPRTPSATLATAASFPLLALALGFGMLGLFDDLSEGSERGLRGHLEALRGRRLTTGGLKLIGGSALAFGVAAAGATSLGWALADGAVIALGANLFNALDVRPGRAGKAFLAAGVPLAVLGGSLRPALAAALGAAAAFLREDLRERAMLGDAGANALGALVGGAVVLLGPKWVHLVVLALLAGLTWVAEFPTLSSAIDRIPALKALDRAGRVP